MLLLKVFLIRSLKDDCDISLSFEDNLKKYFNNYKENSLVKSIVWESLS
jgi:hypothetical protein